MKTTPNDANCSFVSHKIALDFVGSRVAVFLHGLGLLIEIHPFRRLLCRKATATTASSKKTVLDWRCGELVV